MPFAAPRTSLDVQPQHIGSLYPRMKRIALLVLLVAACDAPDSLDSGGGVGNVQSVSSAPTRARADDGRYISWKDLSFIIINSPAR